ncbi:unnamed protein product, partial [marine sediment metagenome]
NMEKYGKKKKPWYLTDFGLNLIVWSIIGILVLIFAPQILVMFLHG